MKTRSIRRLTTIALLCGLPCSLTTSCVTYTKHQDEPRVKTRFASTTAAQVFYDAYASVGTPMGKGSIKVGIMLQLPYSQTNIDTENKKFNAAIHMADTDHDNLISEKEARVYSKSVTTDRG